MYFFIEKYKISHQMVTFPWKELPDFHIFTHHAHPIIGKPFQLSTMMLTIGQIKIDSLTPSLGNHSSYPL